MDELSPKRVRFFENCYYFESLSWNSAAFRFVSMVVKNNNNWPKQAKRIKALQEYIQLCFNCSNVIKSKYLRMWEFEISTGDEVHGSSQISQRKLLMIWELVFQNCHKTIKTVQGVRLKRTL